MPKNEKLVIKRLGNGSVDIETNGRVLMSVRAPSSLDEEGLVSIGTFILKSRFAQRPILDPGPEGPLVTSAEWTLAELKYPNGFTRQFNFGVTKNMIPNLELPNARDTVEITWESGSGLIRKFGDFTFKVSPNTTDVLADAKITRVDMFGTALEWSSGVDTMVINNNQTVFTVANLFGGGPFAGKSRETRKEYPDGSVVVERNSYSATGNLLRKVTKEVDDQKNLESEEIVEYSDEGIVKKIVKNGELKLTSKSNEVGQVFEIESTANDYKITYDRNSLGELTETYYRNGKPKYILRSKGDELLSIRQARN
jgi:hypothetical protein